MPTFTVQLVGQGFADTGKSANDDRRTSRMPVHVDPQSCTKLRGIGNEELAKLLQVFRIHALS
jgi:hypothetical protein